LHICNYKSEFVKRKLLQHKKDIVWLDADAVVQQYPILFDVLDEDVAVHYRHSDHEGDTLHSGTIYFRYNQEVLNMVDKWIEHCKCKTETFDQRSLQSAVRVFYNERHKIRVMCLPDSYFQIYDLMNWGKPVIEHFQASRKFRGKNANVKSLST